MKQLYTQNGGVRPFGSALIIGGICEGESKLFETDPSGALIEYKATAIGSGRSDAMDVFEEKYQEDMTLDEAIDLALDAVYEATEGKTNAESVEIAVIEKENEKYRKLTQEEVSSYIDKLVDKKSTNDEKEDEE